MEERRELTHLDASGSVRMVDVSGKPSTLREAVARGYVAMRRETLELIRKSAVPKGDVLAVARVAGIMAAKGASRLIPLCHPLALDHVRIDLQLTQGDVPGDAAARGEADARVDIEAVVRTRGPTGAEMEALAAVMGAALTVYDMCKGVDRGMVIRDVCLIRKEGGRSGRWERKDKERCPDGACGSGF